MAGSVPDIDTLLDENRRLRRAVEELSVLNDLARVIGGSLNSEDIMQTLIRKSLKAVNADQGVVTLVDEDESKSMKTLVRTMVTSGDHEKFHVTENMLGWMQLNHKPLMINDPQNDQRFKGVTWNAEIRNALSVPMIVKSKLMGVLTVFNKKNLEPFQEDDQRLLAIIAAQSAQIIENARLYEQEKSLVKMTEEIRLASEIQMNLLPEKIPALPNYDVAARYVPAQVVGGDYFDFIRVDHDLWAIALGDVSGKGLPAAMLMSNLQATLRSLTTMTDGPMTCVEKTNRLLCHSTAEGKFVTLFYGLLDTTKHILRFTNAGQDAPMVVGPSGEKRLKGGGIPVAMLEDFTYEEQSVMIHPGDVVVIFSDGIPEAFDKNENEFGEERLLQVLQSRERKSANEIADAIIEAATAHAAGVAQADDMTLVVVKHI